MFKRILICLMLFMFAVLSAKWGFKRVSNAYGGKGKDRINSGRNHSPNQVPPDILLFHLDHDASHTQTITNFEMWLCLNPVTVPVLF